MFVIKNRTEKHSKVAPPRFSKKSLGTVAIPSESQRTGGDKGRVRLNAGKEQRIDSVKRFPSRNSTHKRPQRPYRTVGS